MQNRNLWGNICKSLGFPGHDEEMAGIHFRCLHEYEREWLAKRKGHASSLSIDRTQQAQTSAPTNNDTPSAGGIDAAERVASRNASARPQTPALQKQESSESAQTLYRPLKRKFDTYAGLDLAKVTTLAKEKARLRPYPTFQELGRLDIQALSRSVQSGLPAEVGNALDILVVIAGDKRWGLPLIHCADLLEILIECMADNTELLKPDVTSPLQNYQDVLTSARRASSTIQAFEVVVGTTSFEQHIAIERIMAILTILRNLAFTEINQEPIAKALCTNDIIFVLISTFCAKERPPTIPITKTLDFMKDMITLLSLTSSHIIVPKQDMAQILIQFIIAFAPLPAEQSLGCLSFSLADYPYLAPATDTCAKLLSRDIPNRAQFEQFLSNQSTAKHHPLTALLSLSLVSIPSTLGTDFFTTLPRRIPLLHHALIIAEAVADICPPASADLARSWMQDRILALRLTNLLKLLNASSSTVRTLNIEGDVAVFCRRLSSLLRLLHQKSAQRTGPAGERRARAEDAMLMYECGVD